ncbi:MAG: ABC transporter ATP-binding protein [Actinomycetaceae bacterium]|nr:ABC transporter ATP-binding protein [Actinomycetaceae bacterium]
MKLPLSDERTAWKLTWETGRPYRHLLVVAVALQLISVGITVAIPWIIGRLLDLILAGTTQQTVINHLALVGGLVLIQMVISYFAEYYSNVFSESMFADLRADLVENYLQVPLADVESAGSGDLISRGTHDVDSLRYALQMGISTFILTIIQIILTYAAAFYVSWELALVLLIFLPVFILVARTYLKLAVPAYKTENAYAARLSTQYTETIEQATTVEAFNLQKTQAQNFLQVLNGSSWMERYTALLRSGLFAFTYWTLMLPVAVVIVSGIWMIDAGWVTVGAVTAVTLYALQLEGPLDMMTWLVDIIQTTSISLRRIFGVGLARSNRPDNAVPLESAELVVDNVSFEYRPGMPVLSEVSLDIVPGETLAIVGPSGAGKSTLGRLLAGINDPTSGVVSLGGVSLAELPEADLRSQVVLVTQEHHVFLGTLRSNLQMVAPMGADFSEGALWDALDAVEASSWVRALPLGLDTEVGSGKLELSAAQSQQLALARIVLLDPAILVLDEATSLIDPTSARSLERSMRSVLAGRTVISIAHRLYTSHDADRIAVMIDGRVVELGSHDELVAAGGEYASLWRTWQHV